MHAFDKAMSLLMRETKARLHALETAKAKIDQHEAIADQLNEALGTAEWRVVVTAHCDKASVRLCCHAEDPAAILNSLQSCGFISRHLRSQDGLHYYVARQQDGREISLHTSHLLPHFPRFTPALQLLVANAGAAVASTQNPDFKVA